MIVYRRIAAATLIVLLGSCGSSEPRAEVKEWAFTRTPAGGYDFKANATLYNGADGWFSPVITTVDERSCSTTVFVRAAHPGNSDDPNKIEATLQHHVPTKHKVSRVTVAIVYRLASANPADLGAEQTVFTEDRILEPKGPLVADDVCPPSDEAKAETAAQERRVLKSEPSERDEEVATFINLAGHLCGRVLESYLDRNGTIVAKCTETRSGKGRVYYRIDTDGPTVSKIR